jgi:hypothetical protein
MLSTCIIQNVIFISLNKSYAFFLWNFFVNKKDCITLRYQKRSDTCLRIHQDSPPVLPHVWKPEQVDDIVQGPESDTCLKKHQDSPPVLPHAWKPEQVVDIVQGPTNEPESNCNKKHCS